MNEWSSSSLAKWRSSTFPSTERSPRVLLLAPSPRLAADLTQELHLSPFGLVWHRDRAGLLREREADAVIAYESDPVDITALVRRATASPLLVVGGDGAMGAACLDLGADAWLPSDASVRLVAAQLRSLLRNRNDRSGSRSVLHLGNVTLDLAARRSLVCDAELELAPREFELLKVLAENVGRALSRDRILSAAWGPRFVGEPKTVDVHIAWLRQKLEGSGLRVTTIRGIGYRLDVIADAMGTQTDARARVAVSLSGEVGG